MATAPPATMQTVTAAITGTATAHGRPPLCRGFVMHPMKRMLHEFGRVFQIELGLDVLTVSFNGPDAQMEFARDLARAVAFANEPKDFQFAVGQRFDRRQHRLRFAGG